MGDDNELVPGCDLYTEDEQAALISGYMNNTLHKYTRADFERHLAACQSCRETLALLLESEGEGEENAE